MTSMAALDQAMTAGGGPRRGPSLTRLLLAALCVVLCCTGGPAGVPGAEAYAARYIGMRYTFPIALPDYACQLWYDGYLPNLYTAARDAAMKSVTKLLDAPKSLVFPLSGRADYSLCTLANNCVWQWRGGPFEKLPLTFYVGLNYTGGPRNKTGLFHRWIAGGILTPIQLPRVGFLANLEGWQSTALTLVSRYVTCEVTLSPDSESTTVAPTLPNLVNLTYRVIQEVSDEDDAHYVDPAEADSPSRWWIGVVVGVCVALVVVIIGVLVAWRLCFSDTTVESNAAAKAAAEAEAWGGEARTHRWADADADGVDGNKVVQASPSAPSAAAPKDAATPSAAAPKDAVAPSTDARSTRARSVGTTDTAVVSISQNPGYGKSA